MNTKLSILGALGWVVLTLLAAFIGARFPIGEWYAGLTKPSWNPPNWLFGPVWTVLYLLMALAAWLVWRKYSFSGASGALALFIFQLGLNAAWSWIFFGLHQIGLALFEILVLWAAISLTIIKFWQLNPLAGVLLLPYLAWVTFASVLNLAIWRLNH